MATPNDHLQQVTDLHTREHKRNLVSRYDDVADAHHDLVQNLRDMYGTTGHPHPLLKNLKGPTDGRRETVREMNLPDMRKAVEAYEHWYSKREALATGRAEPHQSAPMGVHMPHGDSVQRSLGKHEGLRREVLVTSGDGGREGHVAYTTARRARMWGLY